VSQTFGGAVDPHCPAPGATTVRDSEILTTMDLNSSELDSD